MPWNLVNTAPDWIATGLTGATAASRYVGATASGAPASGTFALGDYIIDQTGAVYVCTTAGSPGTWTKAGGGAAGQTKVGAVLPYPSSFSGDSNDFTTTETGTWPDVTAFNIRECLNSTILHLQAKGSGITNQIRRALTTTKAGAFDFRTCLAFTTSLWAANGDTKMRWILEDGAHATLATFQISDHIVADNGAGTGHVLRVDNIGAGAGISAFNQPWIPVGSTVNMRITRDGSNNLLVFIGFGSLPTAYWIPLNSSDDSIYNIAQAGTVTFISYYVIHPTSGANQTSDLFIDTFESL